MSAEVYSEPEESTVLTEVTRKIEYEPREDSCENILGFTALCASCPLVAQLGGCPKQIRENAASNTQPDSSNETFGDFLYSGLGEAAYIPDLLTNPVSELAFETVEIVELIETIEADTRDGTRDQLQEHDQSYAESEEDQTAEIPQKKPTKRPTVTEIFQEKSETITPKRSFRDLLFDDSVAVVLAPQFTPRKKRPVAEFTVASVTKSIKMTDKTPSTKAETIKPKTPLALAPRTITTTSDEQEEAPLKAPLANKRYIINEDTPPVDKDVAITCTIEEEATGVPEILPSKHSTEVLELCPTEDLFSATTPAHDSKALTTVIESSPSVDVLVLQQPKPATIIQDITEEASIVEEIPVNECLEDISPEPQINESVDNQTSDAKEPHLFVAEVISDTNAMIEINSPAQRIFEQTTTRVDNSTVASLASGLPIVTIEHLATPLKTLNIHKSWSYIALFGSIVLQKLIPIQQPV